VRKYHFCSKPLAFWRLGLRGDTIAGFVPVSGFVLPDRPLLLGLGEFPLRLKVGNLDLYLRRHVPRIESEGVVGQIADVVVVRVHIGSDDFGVIGVRLRHQYPARKQSVFHVRVGELGEALRDHRQRQAGLSHVVQHRSHLVVVVQILVHLVDVEIGNYTPDNKVFWAGNVSSNLLLASLIYSGFNSVPK